MILSSTSKNNSKSNNTNLCVYLQLNTYNERTMQLKYSQFELHAWELCLERKKPGIKWPFC